MLSSPVSSSPAIIKTRHSTWLLSWWLFIPVVDAGTGTAERRPFASVAAASLGQDADGPLGSMRKATPAGSSASERSNGISLFVSEFFPC